MDTTTDVAAIWRDGHRTGWDQATDAAIGAARQAGADQHVLAALHQLASTPAPTPAVEPAPGLLAAAAALETTADRVQAAGCPPELLDALAALLRITAAGTSGDELRAAIARTARAVPTPAQRTG